MGRNAQTYNRLGYNTEKNIPWVFATSGFWIRHFLSPALSLAPSKAWMRVEESAVGAVTTVGLLFDVHTKKMNMMLPAGIGQHRGQGSSAQTRLSLLLSPEWPWILRCPLWATMALRTGASLLAFGALRLFLNTQLSCLCFEHKPCRFCSPFLALHPQS